MLKVLLAMSAEYFGREIVFVTDARKLAASLADRTYVYDNSTDGVEAQLLFRMTDGKVFKEYVTEIPEWAQGISGK